MLDRKIKDKTYREKNKEHLNFLSKKWREEKKDLKEDYYSKYNLDWRYKRPERYLLQKAKGSAKKTGKEFNLVEEDIVIPELCPVLGFPLTLEINKSYKDRYNSPSIDRFDNTKGYTKDNINVISWRANSLKADGTK